MLQKGLSTIVIVLLIAAAIGGYLVYSSKINLPQKQDSQTTKYDASPVPNGAGETANWKTYNGRYFSISYPNTWYQWSFGRGVDLDYFQINSIPSLDETSVNRSHIAFDIQGVEDTDTKTLEEQRKALEDLKRKYPDQNYIISEQNVDGQRALVYETTIDNTPSYAKTISLVRGSIEYGISWTIIAQSVQERDKLMNRYKTDFDQIISTFKFTE